MWPHQNQVQPPSTEVQLLRQTTPIEQVHVQCGWVRIERGGIMQQHTRKMTELQGE